MNQPHHEPASGGTQRHATPRERELEIELARIRAELEAATGGDEAAATSRFLALAASTVDLAVDEARREADELAAELSADAERRRDEAARIAADAETSAARLRDQADKAAAEAERAREAAVVAQSEADASRSAAQEVTTAADRHVEEARSEAKAITDDAHAEADELRANAESVVAVIAAQERSRLTAELETITEVRGELENEREALVCYHDELRQRVRGLAESMISFMTTDAPIGAMSALDELEATTLVDIPDLVDQVPTMFVDEASDEADFPEAEPVGDVAATVADAPAVVEQVDSAAAFDESEPPDDPGVGQPVTTFVPVGLVVAFGPTDEGDTPETAGEVDRQHHAAGEFDPAPAEQAASDDQAGAGLFAAASEQERAPGPLGSLFSEHGDRLIAQTAPNQLADETDEDDRFHDFLHGDDEDDPSREWLLRPEGS